MISRRSRWCCNASGKRSTFPSGNSGRAPAEIGIVRHRTVEQLAVKRELGIGEQHRKFRPRQRLHCACAVRDRDLRRAEIPPRGRAAPRASSVCIRRCWKPRSSIPRRCAKEIAQRLLVIVAQDEMRHLVGHLGQAARCVPRIVSLPARTGAAERDLDIDLDVGGVDPGGIVDRIGIEPHAALRRLDAAALGHAEIGALADDLTVADRRR